MADDTQQQGLGGHDPASGLDEGVASPPELSPEDAPGGNEPAAADRFDPGLEEALWAGGVSGDTERSRVDGLPDGWLDDPGAGDAAEGPDVLAATNLHDDPEASGVSHSSQVQIGTGQSGITSPSDVVPVATPPQDRSISAVDREDHFFKGIDLTEKGGEDPGEDDGKPADEWRDIVATGRDDVPSESIGFGAFVGAAEAVDPAIGDSFQGDSQGIGESPGESIDIGAFGVPQPAAVPAGPFVTSGPRPSAARGGMGQAVGVVLGGVLAIPVTLAILLFGFQRDPLRITPHLPAVVRSFLPARFRPAVGERRAENDTDGPGRLTLDQIAAIPSSGDPLSDGASQPVAYPVAPAIDAGLSLAGDQPAGETVVAPDAGLPAQSPADPIDEVEIVVDPLRVGAAERNVGPDVRGTVIDFSAVDGAIAAAAAATDNLAAGAVGGDPADLEQAQVGWYRSMSLVALELARMERAAIESGRRSSDVVDRFADLGRRLAVERRDDLELLGSMWLASGKRPSEGAILIATLEAVRPVGPWWGGRLSVGGETPGVLSFLAQTAPRAEPGERVMVVGVLGDPGTIWAVDVGPLSVPGNPPDDTAKPRSF